MYGDVYYLFRTFSASGKTEPVRALRLDTGLHHHPGTPGCSPCRLQLANSSGSNKHLHHVLIKTVLLRFLRSDQHSVHISELRAVQRSVGTPHLSAYPTDISYSLIFCSFSFHSLRFTLYKASLLFITEN